MRVTNTHTENTHTFTEAKELFDKQVTGVLLVCGVKQCVKQTDFIPLMQMVPNN